MDPINYTGQQGQNGILQSLAPWIGMTSQIQQNQLNQQTLDQRKAEFQAQQESARQAQEQSRLAAIAQAEKQQKLQEVGGRIFGGGDATPEDYAFYTTNLDPKSIEAGQKLHESRNEEARQSFVNTYGGIKSALDTKTPEGIQVAKEQADQRIAALQNSTSAADKAELAGLQGIRKMMDTNPAIASGWIGTGMYATPEGQKYIDSQYKDKGQPSEIALREAQAAEAWANAMRQKTGSGLSQDADKIINSATDNVTSSVLLANQAENLATAFEQARPAGGWAGNAMEWLKKAAGGQDKYTSLKQEYVKLRNTDVLKNLPPGVASDKDIEIALKAFPDENSNPDQISAFLRGTAKLNRYNAEVNKTRAEWVMDNGNLGPAKSDLSIGGKTIPKGTSFWDYTAKIPIPNVAGGVSSSGQPAASPTNPPAGKAPASAPSGAPAQTQSFSSTVNGKTYSFPSAEAKAAFEKAAREKGLLK